MTQAMPQARPRRGAVTVVMAGTTVVEIAGAATPVVTPLSIGVKNNTVGARP